MSGIVTMPVGPACVAGLAFAVGGFTWLAQAIERHHADMFGRGSVPSPARVRRLRWQGAAALMLALAAVVSAEGWAFGVIYWTGLLTVSALTVAGAFACAPRATPRLARAAFAAGIATAVVSPWLMQP